MSRSKRCVQLGLLLAIVMAFSAPVRAAKPIPTDRWGRPLYQAGVVAVDCG